MEELELSLKFVDRERPWAGWMKEGEARPLFLIGRPENGQAATAGNGQMVALLAPNRDRVKSAYHLAMELGATCEGAPGLRPDYHPDYFGAYFKDLDGNKICLVCHDPV